MFAALSSLLHFIWDHLDSEGCQKERLESLRTERNIQYPTVSAEQVSNFREVIRDWFSRSPWLDKTAVWLRTELAFSAIQRKQPDASVREAHMPSVQNETSLVFQTQTGPSSLSTYSAERQSRLLTMNPAWLSAWLALEYATQRCDGKLKYREAWRWLTENGMDDEYKLPSLQTFCDYCSKAASHMGEQRKTPRGARNGRSMVKNSDI